MQSHESGSRRRIFEVKGYRLDDIATEFVPSFRLREDGMVQRASAIPSFVRVTNVEDHFHAR